MQAIVKDGNLIISIPLQTPTLSTSGKSKVVASSHGNRSTEVKIEGKPVIVGINAYISTK